MEQHKEIVAALVQEIARFGPTPFDYLEVSSFEKFKLNFAKQLSPRQINWIKTPPCHAYKNL